MIYGQQRNMELHRSQLFERLLSGELIDSHDNFFCGADSLCYTFSPVWVQCARVFEEKGR